MTPIPSAWAVLEPLIIEQYKESPQYLGILQLIAAEADRTETARWELANLLDIDAMSGVQLDLLGKIGNAPRLQAGVLLNDATYRLALKAAFQARTSGTPEEIIAAVRSATNSATVVYIPEYPAAYWLLWDGPGHLTEEFLTSISPAGVLPILPCFLSYTDGDTVELVSGGELLIIGPCESPEPPPTLDAWDGGLGAVDPDTMVFTDPQAFRDSDGIGEYPDGGLGAIDPDVFTFTDGTWADDLGG